MIADSNNLVGFVTEGAVGMVGGNWVLLGIIFFLIIGFALIWGRARASVVLMSGLGCVFVFSLLSEQFAFLFWIVIIVAIFVLLMGLRRWITGQ